MGELKSITTNRVTEESETLPCRLTDAERMDIGDEIARLNLEANHMECEAESLKDQAKSILKKAEGLREQIKGLAYTWHRGTVDRAVTVEREIDYRSGLVSYTRTDTGEVYKTREILPGERQMSLVNAD